MLLGPRDSISNIVFLITRWVISSLWILSPKPFAVFLNIALFLPWGQARDSIQGPLVSDQLDSIPNLGLNPWLQAKVYKQRVLAIFNSYVTNYQRIKITIAHAQMIHHSLVTFLCNYSTCQSTMTCRIEPRSTSYT